MKQAFEVLNNQELKRAYSLLGEAGVKVASRGVIDAKYILIQMVVYYGSSLIFTFLMTFSESSGEAIKSSFFGLLAMLLIECLLVIEEWKLPSWFFPYYSTHDVISFIHRLYPVYINCIRCVMGAFHTDFRNEATKRLDRLTNIVYQNVNLIKDISNQYLQTIRISKQNDLNLSTTSIITNGYMAAVLEQSNKHKNDVNTSKYDPRIRKSSQTWSNKLSFLRNLLIYCLVSYCYILYKYRKQSS